MYMNQAQFDNVDRALKGVQTLVDAARRKMVDKSVAKNIIALDEIATLVQHAKDQLL